jgi:hypothetical protein
MFYFHIFIDQEKTRVKCDEYFNSTYTSYEKADRFVIEFAYTRLVVNVSDFLHEVIGIVSIIIFIGLHVRLLQQAIVAPKHAKINISV